MYDVSKWGFNYFVTILSICLCKQRVWLHFNITGARVGVINIDDVEEDICQNKRVGQIFNFKKLYLFAIFVIGDSKSYSLSNVGMRQENCIHFNWWYFLTWYWM